MRLAFVSRRRARRACVKNGGQPALVFASKGGGPIYLLRAMVSGNKKKRKRKKKTESGTQRGKEAHPGEEGEGEEGEEGGKTHPKMWKRWGGIVSWRREGWGVVNCGARENDLGVPTHHKVDRGNFPKQCHIATSLTVLYCMYTHSPPFCLPAATQVRFLSFFLRPC